MGVVIEVKYFNSFVLKKTVRSENDAATPVWNGSPGVPESLKGYPIHDTDLNAQNSWNIEEATIRGGYNNTYVDLGVKAYIADEEPKAATRGNSLIYSGIYNSRTGINNTNVFAVGEEITKSADPANGSIQKLYAEDTNLIVFQESKVSRALIDKDAIYTAEGGTAVTNINTTIGTIQPYTGEFGISKDPTSFAVYGYRKYFTDKNRNAVLRLSRDGITEISTNGMYSFFRNEFNDINTPGYTGNIKGGFDIHTKQYVLSTQQNSNVSAGRWNTLSFNEKALGWTSFFTYKPDQIFSMKNKYYTTKNDYLYLHHKEDAERGMFYGSSDRLEDGVVSTASSVTLIFNASPSLSKVFKTVKYEGSSGWQVTEFSGRSSSSSDEVNQNQLSESGSNIKLYDEAKKVYSHKDGEYVINPANGQHVYRTDPSPNDYLTVFGQENPDLHRYYAGFHNKEGKYHAELKNASSFRPGEIISPLSVSGVKGYFANVTISTDDVTALGSHKELFAVSSEYVESNY